MIRTCVSAANTTGLKPNRPGLSVECSSLYSLYIWQKNALVFDTLGPSAQFANSGLNLNLRWHLFDSRGYTSIFFRIDL